MRKNYAVIIGCILLLFTGKAIGQHLVTDANKKQLDSLSTQLNNTYAAMHQKALGLAQAHGWKMRRVTKSGGVIALQGINSLGFPVYLITHNLTSAQTRLRCSPAARWV